MAALTKSQAECLVAVRRALADHDFESAGELSRQIPSRFLCMALGDRKPDILDDAQHGADWPDTVVSLENFNALRPATPYSKKVWKEFYDLFWEHGRDELREFVRFNHKHMGLDWGALLAKYFKSDSYDDADSILRAMGIDVLRRVDFGALMARDQNNTRIVKCVKNATGVAGVMCLMSCIILPIVDAEVHKNRRERLVRLYSRCEEKVPDGKFFEIKIVATPV